MFEQKQDFKILSQKKEKGYVFIMCISLFSCICSFIFGKVGYTDAGTEYGAQSVAAYTKSNHGPDGSLFLDPYFEKDLQDLEGETVLDAGCGAAPWSIYAAKNGGNVHAIDLQKGMIQSAQEAIKQANVSDRVFLQEGDVANLPYKSNFFDRAISICVGCNLPKDSFDKHISEFRRTLKSNGLAVIGAPTSLDVVFTNGNTTTEQALEHINTVLDKTPLNPSSDTIQNKLIELSEVLSATFFVKDGKLSLLTKQVNLEPGTRIWRKLPTLVIPNYYYSSENYQKALKEKDFEVIKIDLPHFSNEEERALHNSQNPEETLGESYTTNSPFAIFHARKTTQSE